MLMQQCPMLSKHKLVWKQIAATLFFKTNRRLESAKQCNIRESHQAFEGMMKTYSISIMLCKMNQGAAFSRAAQPAKLPEDAVELLAQLS